MRNNKILAAAIASALSLGAGNAFAANLELRHPKATADTFATVVEPSTYAAELFSDATTQIASDGDFDPTVDTFKATDTSFVVAFPLGISTTYPVESGAVINVKATLSKGSWASTGIVPQNQVIICGSAALAAGALCGDAPYTDAKILKGNLPSGAKDAEADFNIYPGATDITSTAYLFFSFAVDDLTALSKSGSLSLAMESSVYPGMGAPPQTLSTGQSVVLAKSLPAITINITAETIPKVAIDVDQALKGFLEGTSTPKDTACLGTLEITSPKTPPRKTDGSLEFTYDPVAAGSTATLNVTSGPFAASGAKVFLSLDNVLDVDDGDGIWEAGEDIVANTIDANNAKWTLTAAQIDEIENANGGMKICLQADGTNEINEQPVAPTATFSLKYSAASTEQSYAPRRLRHIKNNGSNCTLYNIPDGTMGLGTVSLDKMRLKVHNRSTTKTGTLKGSLYGEDGRVLFENVDLLPAAEAFGPGMTLNFNTGEDNEYDLAKLAKEHWVGERAILKLTSNLQEDEFEVFGLVRSQNDQSVGNLSAGATGSGCQ